MEIIWPLSPLSLLLLSLPSCSLLLFLTTTAKCSIVFTFIDLAEPLLMPDLLNVVRRRLHSRSDCISCKCSGTWEPSIWCSFGEQLHWWNHSSSWKYRHDRTRSYLPRGDESMSSRMESAIRGGYSQCYPLHEHRAMPHVLRCDFLVSECYVYILFKVPLCCALCAL